MWSTCTNSAPKSNYHKQTLTHVRTFEIANENKKCSQGGGITICFAPIPVFHDYYIYPIEPANNTHNVHISTETITTQCLQKNLKGSLI